MNAADIYIDGFPHGTPSGYEQGCRGSGGCPERAEERMTCSQSYQRYHGDIAYKRLIDAGKTPEQIAAIDAEQAEAARTKAKKPSPPKPAPAPSEPPATATPAPTPAPAVQESDDEIPLEKHGTTRGYSAGCRRNDCPGIPLTGESCRQAASRKAAESKARKKAERTATATSTADHHVPWEEVIAAEQSAHEYGNSVTTVPDTAIPSVPAGGPEIDIHGLLNDLATEKAANTALREQLTILTLELDVALSQIRRNDRAGLPRVAVDVDRTPTGDVTVQLRIPA